MHGALKRGKKKKELLAAMSASGSPPEPGPANNNNNNNNAKNNDVVKKAFPSVDIEGHNLPPSPAPSSPHGQQRRYALATELVYTDGSDQYNSSSVPIYQVRKYHGPVPDWGEE